MPQSILWLGSQDSYEIFKSAMDKADAHPRFSADADGEEKWLENLMYSRMVSVQDGVGILTISGSLITGTAGYMVFYGVVGYDDIRKMLAKLVADQGVQSILLVMNSGGGSVGGVMDAGELVTRVSKVKPMVTYTGSIMASAALWLGASTEFVMASQTAVVGSIGVLQVHIEYSKQMENDGVKATVIRGGEFKALANRYEPLTEVAKENMEAQASHLEDVFISYMADRRQVSKQVALDKFGKGREFVGSQAKSAGLVDKIGSLEDAFMKAQALGREKFGAKAKAGVPNNRRVQASVTADIGNMPHNAAISEGNGNMTQALTTEQLTAMAAGVTLGDEQTETQEASTEGAAVTEDAPAKTDASTEAPAADAMAVLKEMLADAQTQLASAKVELGNLQATLDAQKPQFDAAIEIVRSSVRTMGLHFGIKKEAVAAMSATEVLAEHSKVAEQFKEKFKTAAVAATATAEDTQTNKSVQAAVDHRLMAYAAKLTSGKR